MNFLTFAELRSMLDLKSINGSIAMQAFEILDLRFNVIWCDYDQLEIKAKQYAINQGWNPDTTLVLYSPPTPALTTEQIAVEAMAAAELDFQIVALNSNQINCSLFPNLTKEELANTINKVARMKAFL